ncbi:MAG: hypothetical protein QM729_02705 [Solirubrobacterales bacterium]
MAPADLDPTRGFYLDTGAHRVFAIEHPAEAADVAGTPVLLCAPWGWDEVASYRSRKRWAERLAGAGFTTLRFDLPAVGDSDGHPSDPDLGPAWVAAVRTAAEWLRARTGVESVAALGLGLGGLLAREAIAAGAPIDQLVLWGAPETGRAFAREARAFSRLQRWEADELTEPGAIEAGGFLLSAGTVDWLKGLGVEGGPPRAPRRALLLDRDGVGADGLRDALAAANVEVETATGQGWAAMFDHPERSRLPAAVAETVERWLREGGEGATASGAAPGAEATAELALDAVVESALAFETSRGRIFGVLARPAAETEAADDGLLAVFLNAGAVRHSGPDRLWVEASRRAAAAGVPSLRVDLEAIGESDGDEEPLLRVEEFYVPRYADELVGLLEQFDQAGLGRRFALLGLCAGGYWSYRAALVDDRVSDAVLVNPGALVWTDELLSEREARKLTRVVDRRWLRRLLTGDIRGELIVAALRSLVRRLVGLPARLWRRLRHGPEEDWYEADLDRLRDHGTRLTLAFSGNEPVDEELTAAAVPERLERWPNVRYERLPGEDHTLRPLSAQRALLELFEERLAVAAEAAAAQAGSRQR